MCVPGDVVAFVMAARRRSRKRERACRIAAALAVALFVLHAGSVHAQEPPATASFASLAQVCAPHVDTTTLAALVRVESGFNPYAIGVVGARLQYQPHSYEQALATARALAARGYDFSVGLGQVNVRNLARVGESLTTIFDPCRNLHASSAILQQCFARSSARAGDTQGALRDALSCYYSGNFMTGYRQGYVARILAGAYSNWRLAHARDPRPAARPPLPAAPASGRATLHSVGFVTRAPESLSATTTASKAAAAANAIHGARASSAAATGTSARRPPTLATRSIAGTSACASGSSRQQVTVRCADNPHHWCTRCLDTASSVARGGLIVSR